MERNRKLYWAKTGVILGAIPLVIWAYEYGPDPGVCGVPGENGTCAQSGCHSGATNDPAHKGSVTVAFPNGLTYTPGVTQHLTVTISDPAGTQQAWGFQLTARSALTPSTMAGTFVPTDSNTQIMCSQANLQVFQTFCLPGAGQMGCSNESSAPACPAAQPLQYLEHSYTGYQHTQGPGSGSYQFDWIPPANNVGNITIYVAGNAGVAGPPTKDGDHIYATSFTLTPVNPCPAGGSAPAITPGQVANGASYQPGIVPNAYLQIKGTNLAQTTDNWSNAVGPDGELPTTLDCVSVSVGGQPAYVYYVSPDQINVVAPDVGTGTLPVTVMNQGGASAAESVASVMYGPAFFTWPNNQPVATHLDGTDAMKNGTYAGFTTVAASPGEYIVFWGTGFGPTSPPAPLGVAAPNNGTLYVAATVPTLTLNGQPMLPCAYCGVFLAPGLANVYQVVAQVPASMPDGDWKIIASAGGVSSPDAVLLTVKTKR
jgi:uncharacterized protein (TIGR03437 family)